MQTGTADAVKEEKMFVRSLLIRNLKAHKKNTSAIKIMETLLLKIKRAETPFFALLHRAIKKILRYNIPTIRAIHLPLYHASRCIQFTGTNLLGKLWSVPLFSARCTEVGKGLTLPNGIPYVIGDNLKFFLGDDVTIYRSTIGGSKIFDEPQLIIGDRSAVGYGTVISIAKEVVIGNDCMIAPHCIIMDNDDHPIDPKKRLKKEPVMPEDVQPVRIGNNVWIGAYSTILKGVTIGDNSIIAAHSVVTKDVLPNCIYAGYPARPTRRDIDKISIESSPGKSR